MRVAARLLVTIGCVFLVAFALHKHAPTSADPLSMVTVENVLPQSLQGELLKNPGFEVSDGTVAMHWTQDMKSTGGKGVITRDPATVHDGVASIRLEPNASNGGAQPLALTQAITAKGLGGRKLRYAGFARVQAGAVAHLGLLTLVNDKPERLAMLTQQPTDAWSQLSGSYTVPLGANVTVIFICWVDGESGSAWFDDLSLSAEGITTSLADSDAPLKITPATAAQIDVNAAQVIRQIPATLYGANLEWIWNGNGLWLPDQDKPDDKIVRLTNGLGVKLLRYPGGVFSDFYHWKNGVGPPVGRPETLHMPGKDERSRTYFGTDEALRFANEVGAELLLTVNAGSGTAQEAADWVRYVNVPRRRVRFWEIGNELYLNDKELGPHAVTLTPEQYADRLLAFAQAMRAVDPEIKILAIGGENHGRFQTVAYPDWDKVVLTRTQAQIDYLSVHNAYAPLLINDKQDLPTVYRAMLAAPTLIAENLETINRQIELYAPSRAKKISIAVTEWGPAFRFDFNTRYIDHGKTLGSALFAASTFNVLLSSTHTDIANFWQLNDYSVLGWLGTSNTTFPPRPEWIETARAEAFGMYTRYFGSTLIQCDAKSSVFASDAVGLTDAVSSVPDLSSVASLSVDGKHLYVMVVNRSLEHDVQTTFSIHGFSPAPSAEIHTLNGSSLDANTGTGIVAVPGLQIAPQASLGRFRKGGPGEIWQTDAALRGQPSMLLTLPAHSVSALVLTRAIQ